MGAVMAIYQILDDSGHVINTVVADEAFVEYAYPGHYQLAPEPPLDYTQSNKTQAMSLLQAVDWVNQPDVIDSARTPHLLNQSEFLDYREALRRIAVNPPSTEVIDWPILPADVWSR
jgi:hypothetical protein